MHVLRSGTGAEHHEVLNVAGGMNTQKFRSTRVQTITSMMDRPCHGAQPEEHEHPVFRRRDK
jgi:hypothetical protein